MKQRLLLVFACLLLIIPPKALTAGVCPITSEMAIFADLGSELKGPKALSGFAGWLDAIGDVCTGIDAYLACDAQGGSSCVALGGLAGMCSWRYSWLSSIRVTR